MQMCPQGISDVPMGPVLLLDLFNLDLQFLN